MDLQSLFVALMDGRRPNRSIIHVQDKVQDILTLIFCYLNVEDVLQLRKVSRILRDISYNGSIWKGLLLRTPLPIPPLPPSSFNWFLHLSPIEMERLVVQSTSLNALWLEGRGSPDVSSFDPMSRIKELKIVPGGQYLVATRKFRIRKGVAKWAVFVYRMEGVYGPTPLMYVDTGTRAFHLDAKFVTVDGVSVLAIAYVKREWLDPSQVPKEQWSELSKFDPDHDIDILLPLKYRCCVAHVSLETLESWSGRRIKPRKDRRSLKVPELLKEMVSIVSYDERLGNPSLDQYEGGAAVTVVKYPNTILVKPLDTDREWAGVEMSLPSYSERASQKYCIKAVRPLPEQSQILVVRELSSNDHRPAVYHLELYDIPRLDSNTPLHIEGPLHSFSELARDYVISDISVTEPGRSIIAAHEERWETSEMPWPISIFLVTTSPVYAVITFTFYPRQTTGPLPRSPFAWSSAAPSEPPHHWRYTPTFDVNHDRECVALQRIVYSSTNSFRVAPATFRPIICAVEADTMDVSDQDITRTHPKVLRLWGYHSPVFYASDLSEAGKCASLILPREVEFNVSLPGGYFKSMAWDETVGKLCFVTAQQDITVVDFAKAPKDNGYGGRLPLQDHPGTYIAHGVCPYDDGGNSSWYGASWKASLLSRYRGEATQALRVDLSDDDEETMTW